MILKEPATTMLPLAAIVFKGRNFLMIHEVAKALNCANQHIVDLIEEGQIVAVDIAGQSTSTSRIIKPARRCLRIPVASYDNFLRARAV